MIILDQKVKYVYGYEITAGCIIKQQLLVLTDKDDNPDWGYMLQYAGNIVQKKLKVY